MDSTNAPALPGRKAGWLVAGTLAVALALFLLIFATFRPAPPQRVTMLTGAEGGAYQFFAVRYRQAFAAQGIDLVLVPSGGSVENLQRIKTDPSIDLALIQSGIANEPDSTDLAQLGSMFPEAVWIFQRGAAQAGRLDALAGKRIAVGLQGSGTQLMALQMLAATGFALDSDALIATGGLDAAEKLRRGEVDAAFYIASAQAPAVAALLAEPGLSLFDLDFVAAYRSRFPNFESLTLPAGALDLVAPRPPRDVRMLGTTAVMVARADLHPAIISLVLQVARTVHGPAGLFHQRGEYPSVRDNGLPVADQARRFYDSGPPFLQRYLPFWLAVLLDRILVALVPVLALLLPLSRIAPPLYAWRMRARIYRWYGELKFLENEIQAGRAVDRKALLARLREIEEAAHRGRIPLAYANELYTLREHVALVRQRILEADEDQ